MSDRDTDPPTHGRSIKYGEAFFDSAYWAGIVLSKTAELEDLLKKAADDPR